MGGRGGIWRGGGGGGGGFGDKYVLTWEHVDNAHAFLAQEISDLNLASSILNVGIDGKVGIYQPHLVQEALCDSSHHVLHMSCGGTDSCKVLSLAKVAVHSDLLLAFLLEQIQIDCQVLEIPLQLSCSVHHVLRPGCTSATESCLLQPDCKQSCQVDGPPYPPARPANQKLTTAHCSKPELRRRIRGPHLWGLSRELCEPSPRL